jgi:DNA primase
VQNIIDIFESFLGPHRRHDEYKGQVSFDCPACSAENGLIDGDGKGNLEINYFKNVFKCWVCADQNDMKGNVVKLIKTYGNKNILNQYFLIKPEIVQSEREFETYVELPESYKKFTKAKEGDYKYSEALHYIRERGITDEIIDKFNIGFTSHGPMHSRIVIPSYDETNRLNYFIARWFSKKYNKLKYINPDVPKQEIIFNEYLINWDATIYLVEGVFDHIVVPNSIPLLGKNISELLFYKLQTKAKANIVVLLDNDAFNDAVKLYHKLNFGVLNDRIRICKLPDGFDPSKVFEKFGNKGIIHYLSKSGKLKN